MSTSTSAPQSIVAQFDKVSDGLMAAEKITDQVSRLIVTLGRKWSEVEEAYQTYKTVVHSPVSDVGNLFTNARGLQNQFIEGVVKDSVQIATKGVTLSEEALKLSKDWVMDSSNKAELNAYAEGMGTIAAAAHHQASATCEQFRDIRRRTMALLIQCEMLHGTELPQNEFVGKLEDALKSIATNDDFDLETETPLDKLVQWWQDIVTDLQGVQKSLTVLSLGTELRLKAMEAKWKTLLTRYQTYQQRVNKAVDNNRAWKLHLAITDNSTPGSSDPLGRRGGELNSREQDEGEGEKGGLGPKTNRGTGGKGHTKLSPTSSENTGAARVSGDELRKDKKRRGLFCCCLMSFCCCFKSLCCCFKSLCCC